MSLLGGSTFLWYVGVYGVATLGCALALARAVRIDDREMRYGLVGVLAGSGGWAAWELVYFVAPPSLKYGAYLVSLVVGLSTVGAWLYFCSAYTGRSFHRSPGYRRAAVAVYLVITAVKVTNPLHHLYFTTELVDEPFAHMAVQHGSLHWVVTGLSYALVTVGFFMLYELFLEADYDTRPLGVLTAVTAVPVALDVVGYATPLLLDVNYEPLGVTVFAVGALFVFEDRFLAVRLTDGVDGPVVHLDAEGRIREANGAARRVFPSIAGAAGRQLTAVLPAATPGEDGDPVVEREVDGEVRYYLASETSFALGGSNLGRMVVFTDVTETERQRRELARQNEQLGGFAAAVNHELRNNLQVVGGWIRQAGTQIDDGDLQGANEALETAARTADRMSRTVDDLVEFARQGRTPEDTGEVAVAETAETAIDAVETNGLSLSVEADGELPASKSRLRKLFENGFRFADHNGASTVRVAFRGDQITITDDGNPPGDADPEAFFDYGASVPDSGAGMSLPNVRTLARTHGWEATVDTGYDDGVRVVVDGVDTDRTPPSPARPGSSPPDSTAPDPDPAGPTPGSRN